MDYQASLARLELVRLSDQRLNIDLQNIDKKRTDFVDQLARNEDLLPRLKCDKQFEELIEISEKHAAVLEVASEIGAHGDPQFMRNIQDSAQSRATKFEEASKLICDLLERETKSN